jgi:hypothetical protein
LIQPEDLQWSSQHCASCPYPEQDQSSKGTASYYFEILLNIIFPHKSKIFTSPVKLYRMPPPLTPGLLHIAGFMSGSTNKIVKYPVLISLTL